jgi:uncharacterized protein involved in exopolysaccharide biosynthesis/beta-lactamase regulating signal transducer with metallopeptidase domain
MNTLLRVLDYPLAHQIGWAVLHSLWQGACAGAIFALLRFALRRRSANARYLAGCLSLGVLLVAPVLTLLLGSTPSAAPGSGTSGISAFSGADASVFSFGSFQRSYAGTGAYSSWHWGTDVFTQVAPMLAMVWFLGVTIFSARLTRGCWCVRNIRIRDNEPVEAAWMETLNDLRRRLGVSRPVRLLKSALVEVPTVIGWLRPVILLPASAMTGLTPGQLEVLLAHELAHVRRLDYVVNAFQCLVETLMFYHPVAWWISRNVREERENCCDDLVIDVCGDRLAYALALATMEGLRGELPDLAFAASGGSLLNRIRRLLGGSSERGSASIRQLSGLALLGIGLVLIVIGVRIAIGPTIYQSTARIRIEHAQSDISGWGDQRGSPSYDPYFIQTEFELLQSEVILGRVIDNLDLNKEWGGKRAGGDQIKAAIGKSPTEAEGRKAAGGDRLKTWETIALLKSMIELRPVRNTSLIEIRVSSEKADEAARIANAIAEAYRAHRNEQRIALSKGGIKALEERFAEQEAKVNKAQQQVDDLRLRLRINEVPASAASPFSPMEVDTLGKLKNLRVESQAEYARKKALLDRLKSLQKDLGPEGLAQAIPTAVPDTVLSAFLERLGTSEQQLVALSKEFGPEYTEVLKSKAVVEDLHIKIKSRVDGIMLGLDTMVASLSNSLDNLDKEVEKAGQRDIEKATESQPYFEAKRNLDELQRFRQILDAKIAYEKIDVELPKTMMVQVVDRAVPALRPISPNLPRALALIAFGVLLDIAGFVMLQGGARIDSAPQRT